PLYRPVRQPTLVTAGDRRSSDPPGSPTSGARTPEEASMRRMRGLRAGLFVALCTTLIGLASAAPASASTTVAQPTPPAPTAGGGTCQITVTNTDGVFGDEVQALDLQEANGDEIFMRLNGQRFPASTTDTVEFTFAGQGHPASDFGNPTKV